MPESIESRRPIAARNTGWARSISAALVRSGLSPNQVSVFSVIFALVAGLTLATSAEVQGGWRIAALIVAVVGIQCRLLCNLFDGMMAVEGGAGGPLGNIYNDLPDRIADALILIGAGCAARHLEYGLSLGWLAALFAVMTAYVRVLGAANGVGHDFRGPMAKQQRMAIITLAALVAMFDPLWQGQGHAFRIALAIIVIGGAATTVRRTLGIARRVNAAAAASAASAASAR